MTKRITLMTGTPALVAAVAAGLYLAMGHGTQPEVQPASEVAELSELGEYGIRMSEAVNQGLAQIELEDRQYQREYLNQAYETAWQMQLAFARVDWHNLGIAEEAMFTFRETLENVVRNLDVARFDANAEVLRLQRIVPEGEPVAFPEMPTTNQVDLRTIYASAGIDLSSPVE